MKNVGLIVLSLLIGNGLMAQTTILDEDFSNGIPVGWTVIDEDQLTPQTQVEQFTDGWIAFTTFSDTCAASTSYYTDPAGQSQDFLITPNVSVLATGNILKWDSKSFDSNFPESYLVLVSTTDASPLSFTDTVKVVNNTNPFWTTYSVNLFSHGYFDQNLHIAFKNVSTNAYILGIDNVKLTGNDPADVNSNTSIEVNIYPNPVENILQIEADQLISYSIYNTVGQLVLFGNESKAELIKLESGIYYLIVQTNEGKYSQRLVKH